MIRTRTSPGVFFLCLFILQPLIAQQRHFELPAEGGLHWFKGNTHTHTIESDGDSPPDVVARWYKAHGYRFLVISDHNVWVDPARLAGLVDSSFLLIAGEELSAWFGEKPVHVNGLNIPRVIPPQSDSTLLGTVQKNVDAVREVKGVPHINHPNFRWTLNAEVLAQVRNDNLLEIFNGHPLVHNNGSADAPGMEEIWDRLLTGGKRIYGIAVDDAHHFREEFAPDRSNPGRGWVVVRASRLDAREIMAGLETGHFYASTGVVLDDITITPDRLEIAIQKKGDFRYTTDFIGSGGEILFRTGDTRATYTLSGTTTYVRARVTDSGGARAWTQPVFVKSR